MTDAPAMGETTSPVLIINPPDDAGFRQAVEEAVEGGAGTTSALQAALRAAFPQAVVRPRDLAGEAQTVWYVYRFGHWRRSAADAREGYGSDREG